jgi:hypothetical protein
VAIELFQEGFRFGIVRIKHYYNYPVKGYKALFSRKGAARIIEYDGLLHWTAFKRMFVLPGTRLYWHVKPGSQIPRHLTSGAEISTYLNGFPEPYNRDEGRWYQ